MTVATLFVATHAPARTRRRRRRRRRKRRQGEEDASPHSRVVVVVVVVVVVQIEEDKRVEVVKNTTGKRPLQVAHLDTDADRNAVRIASKTPAIPVKTKEYAFDAVFDAQSTNEQVYRNVFLRSGKSSEDANVVETILRGGIATVFAYGATGSGRLTR